MQEFLDENLQELDVIIDNADVLALGFLRIEKRLLIDKRYDALDSPMILIVDQVASVEERLRHLRRLRPRFPNPERFTFFIWPLSVSSLESLGVWGRILKQCRASGYTKEVDNQAEEVIRDIRSLERRETFEAIAGPKYRSIWERENR
ncbi:MAG: hypothetical protein EXR50_02440 [Dehalococcoidia bacterium]|nr:hypothetical protein [Dehalococcoidia bacterium]